MIDEALNVIREMGDTLHSIKTHGYTGFHAESSANLIKRWRNVLLEAAARAPVEPKATFDDWFIAKYGMTFEEAHMGEGLIFTESMKALTRYMREYVSEMVQH